MDYNVSDTALRATTECRKGFSCLKGDLAGECPVEYCVGGKVLFVTSPHGVQCPYKVAYGNGNFCGCPTRKEIYATYKV